VLLVAVVLVVSAVGWAGRGAAPVGDDAVATLTYWVNWRFVVEDTGYFDSFGSPSPLRHVWSLAIEEQWYLLWPLVLILALPRLRRPALAGIVLAAGAASAVAMHVLRDDVDRAYFGTDTRVQALLAGALLAVLLDLHPVERPRAQQWVAALGAVAAVPVALLLWRADGRAGWMYSGGFTALAVLGAVIVGAATLPRGPVARVLALPPLPWLGRISYGLYLWHWPIDVWFTPDRTGLSGSALFASRTALALAVTLASYHLVEQPLRSTTATPRRLRVPAMATGAVVAVIGLAFVLPQPEPSVGPAGADQLPTAAAHYDPSERIAPAAGLDVAPKTSEHAGALRVTVVGDSVGWTLGYFLGGVDGAEVTSGALLGCAAHGADYVVDGRPRPMVGNEGFECDDAPDFWRYQVERVPPDVVLVVLGAWEVFDRQDSQRGRLEVGTPAWRLWMLEGFEHLLGQLAAGAPQAPVALTEVPCYAEPDRALGDGRAAIRNERARAAAVNDVIDQLVEDHPRRVHRLPLGEWLCRQDEPVEERGGIRLRDDGVHFTHDGAVLTWERWLLPRLRRLAA
jgi:peptidoglycan/LPS O-acetylase OafA/YrhL